MQENEEIQREEFQPGEFIFFEGDIDFHFYIVQEGQVQIFTKSASGKRLDIALVEKGESFGEFALLDRQPRSATAQAVTACAVIKVSEKGYDQLVQELPDWASSMLKSFSTRIKNMNEKLKDMPQFLQKL